VFLEFAAPEVIKYEPLDFHTDMWSLGVIAYILLSGQSPFLGDNIALTYCNVEKGKWSFCEEFDENGISDEARDFITKLLIVDKK
jgi:myosin-light-chain kinase